MKWWRRRKLRPGDFKARYDDIPRKACNWPTCLSVYEKAALHKELEEDAGNEETLRKWRVKKGVCKCR